jgi:hypothetical protein
MIMSHKAINFHLDHFACGLRNPPIIGTAAPGMFGNPADTATKRSITQRKRELHAEYH